ncbi:MAG: NUDIX domain-containing protein [Prevotellaceae bacterium]|jgi:8-oxo-dGTP pyrophosphatase MutT (NUDIX family)|nr:NUDIX domain-containing protein [Prevotellaceae bacterium]
MYKIFFNDRVLSICNNWQQCSQGLNAINYKVTKKNEIKSIIEQFQQNSAMQELCLCVDDIEDTMNEFVSLFSFVEAAGGVVCNNNDEWLLIYRHEHWDLPKGVVESGETILETALREVKEECGIDKLILCGFIASTYHTYEKNDNIILKKTHWYSMKYTGVTLPVPQKEEGITEVRWVSREALPEYLPRMFPSVKEVIQGTR